MSARFERPSPGAPAVVRFPAVVRRTLDRGLGVWVIPHNGVPLATITLLIERGTADDPPDRHGLVSFTADLLDEGAGARNAIELAEAFAAIGTHLDVDVGPDALALSVTGLARFVGPALALLADVVMRPRFEAADFARVKDLRINRLRQLSRSAATTADRAFISAIFQDHSYGHGALGTTASLETIRLDEARDCWARLFGARSATLIVVGAVTPDEVVRQAREALGDWDGASDVVARPPAPRAPADPRVLLVDRPGAAQAELRVGHLAPPRATPDFHALVTLNAVVGGQFTSRINRRLREEKGVTYGARTAFEFRRVGGMFSCDSSVDATATADAVGDILAELEQIRVETVPPGELERAKASLTRGYVRNFETAAHLARAAAQMKTLDLPDDAFDTFVPRIETVSAADVQRVAGAHVRPADATIVVVAEADRVRAPLEALGRRLSEVTSPF